MVDINPYSGVSGVSTARQLSAVGDIIKNDPNDLGVKDFLTLMITQLKNQDPTSPQDSSEFLAQIAQFGTVSGIDSLNSSVGGLVDSLSSNQGLQAASLVGRDVITSYNLAPLAEDSDLSGVVELSGAVNGLSLEVKDISGNLINTLQLGPNSGGVVPFSWDGTNLAGERVAPGAYQVSAVANIDGKAKAMPAFTRVKVESVSISGSGDAVLNLAGGATMHLSEVREFH